MKPHHFILPIVATSMIVGSADAIGQNRQRPQRPSDNAMESFEDLRRMALEEYDNYRNEVLADYDKYLEGVWDTFDQRDGKKRNEKPKPTAPPTVVGTDKPTKPETPKQPEVAAKPSKPAEPVKPTQPAKPSEPVKPVEPSKPETPAQPQLPAAYDRFDFYGMEQAVPRIDFDIRRSIASKDEFAHQWKELASKDIANRLLPALTDKAKEMGLNDYLTYRLVKAYVDNKFKGCNAASRLSLVHYLMANAGYDMRIALGGSTPLLLIPCKQMVYARPFLEMNGRRYFVFGDEEAFVTPNGMNIATCRLPVNTDLGNEMDLRIGKLNLPYAPRPYNVSFGDITIAGETNANLYPILFRYPQMPIADYAVSCPDPKLRAEVASQVAAAIKDKEKLSAVDDLLHFVQSGFVYATDEEFHGFEKPYFFEEMLYYDKCDCEDRAIFYTYLLWNVLGTPCHLIMYPGHESVAVRLADDIPGAAYGYGPDTYYISDPTYIGANTGMCMPAYRAHQPVVDYEYK